MAEPAEILGTQMPDGVRFVGAAPDGDANWRTGRATPGDTDLAACVSCGLCLPHCPTYRLTGEEAQSPRGRIAAMKAVRDALASPDERFAEIMDACLVCRACEGACPSHVRFGPMMEAAREQSEPTRTRRARSVRWLGFHWVLPHPTLVRTATALLPVLRPVLPSHVRDLLPADAHPFARLPHRTEPPFGVEPRGTAALLAGCAQDRWFHPVNLATIRVLARRGWTVTVPRSQACCGALAAHNGRLQIARRLATRARHAFDRADLVIVNAAGCSAHMKTYEELAPGTGLPVKDVMELLADEPGPTAASLETTVAVHDPCHAVHAQGIRRQPRDVLRRIPGLRVVEIPDGDRCCGAAGIHGITDPEASAALARAKAEAIASTGATAIASANPGCSMQLMAALRRLGHEAQVVHPVELLDRAEAAAEASTD